jgi:hypothetical protein
VEVEGRSPLFSVIAHLIARCVQGSSSPPRIAAVWATYTRRATVSMATGVARLTGASDSLKGVSGSSIGSAIDVQKTIQIPRIAIVPSDCFTARPRGPKVANTVRPQISLVNHKAVFVSRLIRWDEKVDPRSRMALSYRNQRTLGAITADKEIDLEQG